MIGIIDVDGKLPNLALMKISAYFKAAGETVEFVRAGQEYEKIYAAALFTRSKEKCGRLVEIYGDKVEIGGTGWDVKKRLPEEIAMCKAAGRADMIAERQYIENWNARKRGYQNDDN